MRDAAVCVLDISAGASSWTFCFLGTLAYQYSASAAKTLKMTKAHMMPKLRHRLEYLEDSAARYLFVLLPEQKSQVAVASGLVSVAFGWVR